MSQQGQLILMLSIGGFIVASIVLLAIAILPSKAKIRRTELANRVKSYSAEAVIEQEETASLLLKIKNGTTAQTAQFLKKRSMNQKLAGALGAAGLTLKPEEWVLLCGGTGAFGAVVLFMLGGGSIPAALMGLFFGIAIPVLILRMRVNKRQSQFRNDLPDMLTALASSLSAGASVAQALQAVTEEATGPMGDELNRTLMESRLGIAIPDALEATAARMNCTDLGFVVMAMRLQATHGGNLSDLLGTVANTLRERVSMQRHVAALAAEGKLSLAILMALPVGMLGFMAIIRREYFDFFVGTPVGLMMLGVCAVMMFMGFMWARSIVKVEI